MRIAPFALAVAFLAAAPVAAEIRDIRFRATGEGGLVGISFSQSPRSVTVTTDARGAAILFEGVDADGFVLDPAANPLLAHATLTRLDHGVVLRLDAVGAAWSDVVATRTADGAIVRITIDAALTPDPDEIDTARNTGIDSGTGLSPGTTGSQDADGEASSGTTTTAMSAETDRPNLADGMVETPPTEVVAATPVAENSEPSAPALAPAGCALTAAAVESDGWDLDALTAHSACLSEEGRGDEARPLLERVLAFEPSRFDAALMLAEITEDSGDTAAAQALFEQAAEAARTDGQAAAARARARALAAQMEN